MNFSIFEFLLKILKNIEHVFVQFGDAPEGLAFPRGAAPRAHGVGVSGRSRVRKPMGVAFPLQTLPGLGPGAGLRAHAASISTNQTQKKGRYAFLS